MDFDPVQFLRWLFTTTGPTIAILGLLAFVFREKWKQILARSLTRDVERLKHELVLVQQENAASLAPQLEAVRHDFQKELETYKTSLIAQAEAAKVKADVKKTLSNRYVQIQFDRLVAYEEALGGTVTELRSLAQTDAVHRMETNLGRAIDLLRRLNTARIAAEMFFELHERQLALSLSTRLGGYLDHIGPGRDPLPGQGDEHQRFIAEWISAEAMVRAKIQALIAD